MSAYPLTRAALWGAPAVAVSAAAYWTFHRLTGLEPGLIGIPLGVLIGEAVYRGSARVGGTPPRLLAMALFYAAYALSFAPLAASGLAQEYPRVPVLLRCAAAPFLDSSQGFITQFMVAAGMVMVWTINRHRTPEPLAQEPMPEPVRVMTRAAGAGK